MSDNPAERPVRCLLLALPEVSPAVLYSLHEVLSSVGEIWPQLTGEAETGRRFEVAIVAESRAPLRTVAGFPVAPDTAWDDAGRADVLIVPDLAVQPDADPRDRWPAAAAWLARQHAGGACVASVCSGSVLLAAAGLLDGIEATTHWAFAGLFRRVFPAVRLRPERVLVPAGEMHSVVTSGGAASWSELALYLIARFAGRAEAVHAAKVFLLADRSDGQLPFAAMARPPRSEDAAIDRCQVWIADNYAAANPVQRMIDRSGLPPRSFKRRFRAATGYSPIDYVQTLRIEEAKQILETTAEPVDAVAEQIGYDDPAYFRKLFKRHTGVTPARYRQKFRQVFRTS